MKKQYCLRVSLVIFLSLLCSALVTHGYLSAYDRHVFYNNENYCLSASNGHSGIRSVSDYACRIAARKPINVCASWIGATNDSTSTDIYAELDYTQINSNTTVNVRIWGMCTYAEDTSSNMATAPPNIITCGGSRDCSFKRTGDWGHPSYREGQLNVAKFINGVSPTTSGGKLVYTRNMAVTRTHSSGGSSNTDYTTIRLYINYPSNPDPDQPTPEPSCTSDSPEWHSGSTYNGDVSINVDVGDGRVGSYDGSLVYARPTDEITWYNRYHAGTPGAADIEVSEVTGSSSYKGYEDLSSSMCQPWGGMCAKRLHVDNKRLSDIVSPWQNQFTTFMSWDGQNDHSYSYNNNVDTTEYEYKTIARDEVGQTFTETARAGTYYNSSGRTGIPSYVSIDYDNPTQEVEQEVCEEKSAGTIYYGIRAGTGQEEYWESSGDGSDDILVGGGGGSSPPDGYFENNEYESFELYKYVCENKVVCTNSYDSAITKARVEQDEKSDDASVKVPYNYKNYTSVTIDNSQIFAGETVSISRVSMDVGPKRNDVTRDTYATKVPYSQIKLFAYASSSSTGGSATSEYTVTGSNGCGVIGSAAKSGQCVEMPLSSLVYQLNPDGVLGTYDEYNSHNWSGSYSDYVNNYRVYSSYVGPRTYNAFDLSAGDYMCFVSAIYPASSGSDTQMDIYGDGSWRYSRPSCVVVAKKPTFQVWGGDMYSTGSLTAEVAQKRNVYRDYMIGNYFSSSRFNTTGGTITYFNPWVDQGLTIKNGTTLTVASGAATALDNSTSRLSSGKEGSFCRERSMLSFANVCLTSTEPVGNSGIKTSVEGNRDDLIKYWLGVNLGELTTTPVGSNGWTEVLTDGGSKLKYKRRNGDYGLTQTGDNLQDTHLYIVDGKVTLKSDFKYGGTYSDPKRIPKWIIYANDIDILCNVNEVDAILITKAGGTVNTCSDAGSNNNAKVRSNQLKIFGTVITDKLILGRTYGGGATKTNSNDNFETRSIPNEDKAAEIFDYDPTILVWSEKKSSTAETSGLQMRYQKELAPRY